jgi:hypothetical protein
MGIRQCVQRIVDRHSTRDQELANAIQRGMRDSLVPAARLSDLPAVEQDLMRVLNGCTNNEIVAVRAALRVGQMDGRNSTLCLFGWLGRLRHSSYRYERDRAFCLHQGGGLIESWLIAFVHHGHRPTTHPAAAQFDAWLTAALQARSDTRAGVVLQVPARQQA